MMSRIASSRGACTESRRGAVGVRGREQDQGVRHARQRVHTIERELPARALERPGIREAIDVRAVRSAPTANWMCEFRNVSNGESVTGLAFQTSPSMTWLFSFAPVPPRRSKKSALSATGMLLAALPMAPHHVRHALSASQRIVRARGDEFVARAGGDGDDLHGEGTGRPSNAIVHDARRDGVERSPYRSAGTGAAARPALADGDGRAHAESAVSAAMAIGLRCMCHPERSLVS